MTPMSSKASIGNSLYFLSRFLRKPGQVASAWPSSRALARAMLVDLELAPGDVVVEYGPGTGAFTARLLELPNGDAVDYLGIDLEPGFCERLRKRFAGPRFERVRFAEGRAEDAFKLLEQHGLGKAKAIVSGLPLISMPVPVMREIVESANELLVPGGSFRTFSYVHSYPTPGAGRLRRLMDEVFDRYELSRPVAANFPPALVLRGYRNASS